MWIRVIWFRYDRIAEALLRLFVAAEMGQCRPQIIERLRVGRVEFDHFLIKSSGLGIGALFNEFFAAANQLVNFGPVWGRGRRSRRLAIRRGYLTLRKIQH